MKQQNKLWCLTTLLLAFCLLLTACGGTAATTMHLIKTQGRVGVVDDAGEALTISENMSLYNGYGVDTRYESYAWVNLDDVKLTKMDQNSEIEITRDGKMLEIEVLSGTLFFNVTEPLDDDETMSIRSSNMIVGIRGTCGWVEVPDPEHMKVYLLEGTVEVTVGENSAMVHAGEMAEISTNGEIEVKAFGTAADIPGFVMEEIVVDDNLVEAILAASGIDVLNPPEPDPAADALAAYRPILEQTESYFPDDEEYGDMDVTVTYQYALVQMQTEYPIPALVLEQETFSDYWGDLCTALVFQYDPGSQSVIQAEGQLSEGVAGAGGYRGVLSMDVEQLAVLETSWSSGTGMGSVQRVTVEGNMLRFDTIYQGSIFEESGAPTGRAIAWYDISDLSALDSWTPPETSRSAPPDDGAENETVEMLAGYAGTYTPYEAFHDGYGGGERLQDVSLAENGVITGGGTSWLSFDENGLEPSSITQQEDGSIEITFGSNAGVYTIYPAGVVPDEYTSDYWQKHLDPNAVHLRYLYIDGGVMDILYHN